MVVVVTSRAVRVSLAAAAFLGVIYFSLTRNEPQPRLSLTNPSSNTLSSKAVHGIASHTTTVPSYPSDYLAQSFDDDYCEALYSSRYLEHLASHHIPYCEHGSRSELECFRTHRNESICIATGVLSDPTRLEPQNQTAMHCQLRNFTLEAMQSPAAAERLDGVLSMENMRSGFFDTGVKHQINHWDVNTLDENIRMDESTHCDAANGQAKWTLLVRRENHNNLWHKLMEIWQAIITLDALQMAINPSTGQPYLTSADISEMQIIFTGEDKGVLDEVDELWSMVNGQRPVLQREMEPMCLGKVILPLDGSSSPFWRSHWVERDCHNTFLLDAFLRRMFRHMDIAPTKNIDEDRATTVTIIDRKGRRKIRDLEGFVERSRLRWPGVNFQLVDFAVIPLLEQVRLVRSTDVLLGMTGAGMTHVLWLPEESSVAEIQAPNKRLPEAHPYTGFRNLAKMKGLHYFTGHAERREGAGNWDWQSGEWVDVKEEVFQALIDAAINGQAHKGVHRGEVLPII